MGRRGGTVKRHSHIPRDSVRTEFLQTVHKLGLVPRPHEAEVHAELLQAHVCVLIPGSGTTRDRGGGGRGALHQRHEAGQG
jgi:hypothetical protein